MEANSPSKKSNPAKRATPMFINVFTAHWPNAAPADLHHPLISKGLTSRPLYGPDSAWPNLPTPWHPKPSGFHLAKSLVLNFVRDGKPLAPVKIPYSPKHRGQHPCRREAPVAIMGLPVKFVTFSHEAPKHTRTRPRGFGSIDVPDKTAPLAAGCRFARL